MKWTEEEEQFLIDNYHKDAGYCAEKLNRTYHAVIGRARKLKLTKPSYTKEEIEFLVNNYPSSGPNYCAEKLNKTYSSVTKKANSLALTYQTRWEEEEEQFLIDNYANNGPAYCAEKLNRTYNAVWNKAASLGLKANNKFNINIVYAVYFTDLFLYKVGITNNVERRITEFGHPCVVLKIEECETPQEAEELERNLLKSVTLMNTGYLNNGNSETFTKPSVRIKEFIYQKKASRSERPFLVLDLSSSLC